MGFGVRHVRKRNARSVCGEYSTIATLHMADDLLHLMNHGEHATDAKILEEKRKIYQQEFLGRNSIVDRRLGELSERTVIQDTIFCNDCPSCKKV